MKTLAYILILLGSILTLSNCNRECDEVITVNLKDLHKYVPYTGTESLRFLHNSTDTQTFVGQGMERFYVANKRQQDDGCYQNHESVRIRFVNPQTQHEIKMEYVFDKTDFNVSSSADNSYINYKFYYNNIYYGSVLSKDDLKYSTIESNSKMYNYIRSFHYPKNKLYFFAYRPPVDGNYSGIVKIKTENDTLETIE